MPEFDTFEYDVLVVGAGGAGLRAVIAAREAGCTVGVLFSAAATPPSAMTV